MHLKELFWLIAILLANASLIDFSTSYDSLQRLSSRIREPLDRQTSPEKKSKKKKFRYVI